MRSFKDWYKAAKNTKDDGFTSQDFFNGGWESRQTEVDELQKRVETANRKLNDIASIARRARHGNYYTDSGRNTGLNIASELEQSLKGESNESST